MPTKLTPSPTVAELYALFPNHPNPPTHELIPAEKVPEPYRQLLVHEHHMTVTVEAHHRASINLRVLQHSQRDDYYARMILLELEGTKRVVQFGIVRINLNYCAPDVRAEILKRDKPLGRILIEHDVLRRIEPTAFLRVTPNDDMMHWFGLTTPLPTYGRLAIIHCDHQPAVELLEIVAPEIPS